MTRTITTACAILTLALFVQPRALWAQLEWMEHPSSPVFTTGPSGSWDDGVVFDASIVQVGDTLKMWYTGNDVTVDAGLDVKIGYAWSLDGIQWVRRSEPVISARPNGWDSHGTAGPSVILDGDTLRMWYVTTLPTGAGKEVGYATSVDGINWTRLESPVFEAGPEGSWDGSFLLSPRVLKEDGLFKMWYSAGRGTFPNPAIVQTGYATSSDGIHWTKYDDPQTTTGEHALSDPVLRAGGKGSFDELRAWVPSIAATDDGYEMWYTGEAANPVKQAVGYATSPDGIHWTKHDENPVFESSGMWNYEIVAPLVIRDSSGYQMWFTGFTAFPNIRGGIGYAISSTNTSASPDGPTSMQSGFELHVPYPNPVHESTTIAYDLRQTWYVDMVIYTILGQRIRKLVDAIQVAGSYEVEWDGVGHAGQRLAPGAYVVRAQAGGLMQSRAIFVVR